MTKKQILELVKTAYEFIRTGHSEKGLDILKKILKKSQIDKEEIQLKEP